MFSQAYVFPQPEGNPVSGSRSFLGVPHGQDYPMDRIWVPPGQDRVPPAPWKDYAASGTPLVFSHTRTF